MSQLQAGKLISAVSREPSGEAISVKNLTKTYGSGSDAVLAVDNVSFDIDTGSIVGLLGPNGAGKTSTIKCILGIVLPDSGVVEILGEEIHSNPRRVYQSVGAVFEGARNSYWRLTVRQNLEFFTRLTGNFASKTRDRHDELLRRFDLTNKSDVPVKNLSRGMKQKVSLVSTLSRDVDVVFLDEPTLGLDIETSLALRKELRRMVDEENLTVVLSSHDMSVIEDICDRVIILNDGKVIAHDTIPNLLDLFHNNTYRIRLAAPLPADAKSVLTENFDAREWDQYGDFHEFKTTVSGDEFHELSAVIRKLGCRLRSVEMVESDFSDIFLKLVGDD